MKLMTFWNYSTLVKLYYISRIMLPHGITLYNVNRIMLAELC